MPSPYILHLSKDKKLIKIIDPQQPMELIQHSKIYLRLCRAIMGQQLSTRVAEVMYTRFLNLYGGREPAAKQIADTSFDTLRAIGLSNAKTNYVLNVAKFAMEQGMELKDLQNLSNEEIIELLTRIKGIGKWTVEMLLMFTLGREDVFAVDDLGIQNAMIRLYKLDRTDKQGFRENMLRISKKWKPYRTYACMHLWQWKDNVPAE